VLDYLI